MGLLVFFVRLIVDIVMGGKASSNDAVL